MASWPPTPAGSRVLAKASQQRHHMPHRRQPMRPHDRLSRQKSVTVQWGWEDEKRLKGRWQCDEMLNRSQKVMVVQGRVAVQLGTRYMADQAVAPSGPHRHTMRPLGCRHGGRGRSQRRQQPVLRGERIHAPDVDGVGININDAVALPAARGGQHSSCAKGQQA